MKKSIIIGLICACEFSTMYSQDRFTEGYKTGYKKGYCYNYGSNCVSSTPPASPVLNIGESSDSFQDGYNHGFIDGVRASVPMPITTNERQRYTTTEPEFQNDGMYNAPMALAAQALQYNQKKYDYTIAIVESILNLKVQHIDDEVVNGQVSRIEDYYIDQAKQLYDYLQKDPMLWKSVLPIATKLQAELQKDLDTGRLSKIKLDYKNHLYFCFYLEDIRKSNPQYADRLYNYYMAQFRIDGLRYSGFHWDTTIPEQETKSESEPVQKNNNIPPLLQRP